MIPILYDKYEASFLSNGLGQLADCLSCVVTEEVNGIYEVEFTYPMTGAYYEQLINYGGVIACTHDHNGDVQLFDIYKYDAPIDGIVTFYGSHVSYRLSNWIRLYDYFNSGGGLVFPTTPAELFAVWNNNTGLFTPLGTFTFTDHTGARWSTSFVSSTPYVVRDAMFNTSETNSFIDGSVMQKWKGEWKFNNFNVDFYNRRGQNRGVQIRYGKNMTGVERARDSGSIVSAIVPYWVDSNGTAHNYDTVYSSNMDYVISPWESGTQMYSDGDPLFLCPADVRAMPLNITDKFETQPSQEDAEIYCKTYMSKNSTWRADDNITVEFLDLYGTSEYAGIEGLSNCLCGDFVGIYYPQLGIATNGVEIMSLTYDVLAERVTQMQLNTIRTTLAQVIIDSIGG